MRLCLLGVGLVGGSIGRSLRSSSDAGVAGIEIVGWTPRGAGATAARAAAVIDEVAADLAAAVRGADLVVLAAPPLACLDLLDRIADGSLLGRGALLTDVASTKGAIVTRAEALGLPFVGGHPMAGRETSGFDAGSDDLFVGRPWVVVEAATSPEGGVERVSWLARACGATPIRMSAAEHDDAVAAISHLPLVLSAALAEAVVGRGDWPTAERLAASGWASMTRLARGDPEMGAGILATNRRATAERVGRLEGVLAEWRRAIEAGNAPELERRLAEARAALGPARPAIDQTEP
jgi:prephenate dehydrogenase